jgi:hypothetical protein
MAPICNTDLANYLRSGVFGEDWNADGALGRRKRTVDDDWSAMSTLKDLIGLSTSTALYLYGSHETLLRELRGQTRKKVVAGTSVGLCYEKNIVRYDMALAGVRAAAAVLTGTASLVARFSGAGDSRLNPVRDWPLSEHVAANCALARCRDTVQLPTLVMLFDTGSAKAPKGKKIHLMNQEIDLGSVVPILEGQAARAKDDEYVLTL